MARRRPSRTARAMPSAFIELARNSRVCGLKIVVFAVAGFRRQGLMKSKPRRQHICERESLAGEGIRPRIPNAGRWLIRFVVCVISFAGIRARSESFTFSTLAGNAG